MYDIIISSLKILFGTTIFENIKFGYPNATVEQIEQAARNANAHDFIMHLPEVSICAKLFISRNSLDISCTQ